MCKKGPPLPDTPYPWPPIDLYVEATIETQYHPAHDSTYLYLQLALHRTSPITWETIYADPINTVEFFWDYQPIADTFGLHIRLLTIHHLYDWCSWYDLSLDRLKPPDTGYLTNQVDAPQAYFTARVTL